MTTGNATFEFNWKDKEGNSRTAEVEVSLWHESNNSFLCPGHCGDWGWELDNESGDPIDSEAEWKLDSFVEDNFDSLIH